MNVYDSARMADVLAPLGYVLTDTAQGADMVILNTCHIREKAAEKVFSELGRLRALKEQKARAGGQMVLAVAGCVAQAEGDEIARRAPYVDMIFGPQNYQDLPQMIARANRAGGVVMATDFPAQPKFDLLPEVSGATGGENAWSAFLAIQEGCDKFCSFCVVPYTRGAEYSRPAKDILKEAQRLVDHGACEITLLGQNVNSYHGQGISKSEWGLGRLLRELADIQGLERLRYTTSHPADVDDSLIRAHAEVPALMPFLHLPVQSGSDRVLAAMNRRHSADDYRAVVDRLRSARPDLALSSDFIVGYPGETEADFQDTLRLIGQIGFAQAYSFKYSPRPGTPAADLPSHVPESVKSDRLAELQALLNAQQTAFNRSCIGRVMPVLLDRKGRRSGQIAGRSPYMQSVHVTAPPALMGTVVSLKIEAAHPNSLAGSIGEKDRDPHEKAHL